jgi:hypothetical protein
LINVFFQIANKLGYPKKKKKKFSLSKAESVLTETRPNQELNFSPLKNMAYLVFKIFQGISYLE